MKANSTLLDNSNLNGKHVSKLSRDSSLSNGKNDDPSKDFHYKGNMQDLKPFLQKEGKYRISSNVSQVQYAASLR